MIDAARRAAPARASCRSLRASAIALLDPLLRREAELDDVVGDEAAGAAAAAGRRQARPLAGGGRSGPDAAVARDRRPSQAVGRQVGIGRAGAVQRRSGVAGIAVARSLGTGLRPVIWCQSVSPSVAPRLIAPSGASMPVQSRKLAAPWWTRTSNPSTQRSPRARAARTAECRLGGRRDPPRFADHPIHRPKGAAP